MSYRTEGLSASPEDLERDSGIKEEKIVEARGGGISCKKGGACNVIRDRKKRVGPPPGEGNFQKSLWCGSKRERREPGK